MALSNFETLQNRLLQMLRIRVRSGQLTERSLARMCGVSQPHMHNVLKGVRALSPEFADQILHSLHLTLTDLYTPQETDHDPLSAAFSSMEAVPILRTKAGPGHRIPPVDDYLSYYPFPRSMVSTLGNPVAVVLSSDPRNFPLFYGGDLLLVDRAEKVRIHPNAQSSYLVDVPEGTCVRYIRQGGRRLYLLTEDCLHTPQLWEYVSLTEQNVLDVIRARIVWVGRQMDFHAVEPARKAG